MFYHVSIHHPLPGKRDDLIASMHRYGRAIRVKLPASFRCRRCTTRARTC